ncbi:hypothetical protein E4U42_004644 [Claviceps africana]|uniref:Cytochrome P450 n=1 Tax=Claviceps africana TaxID=83212 RepID=A0A8K0J5J0_9HYPO|nr:hypothetical protein E4U42_004644 [Claviceps africana]
MGLHASLLATLGSLLVLIASSLGWKLRSHRQRLHSLPKPPHSFLLGHIGLFSKASKHFPGRPPIAAVFSLIQDQYNLPDVFYIDLWPFLREPFMVTCNLAVADRFLNDYTRHPALLSSGLQPLVAGSRGLVSPDTSEWHDSRTSIRSAFSVNNVMRFLPDMAEYSMMLRQELMRQAATNRRFPLIEPVQKWGADLTFRFLVGEDTAVQRGGWGSAVNKDVQTIIEQADNSFSGSSWNPWTQRQRRKVREACQERVRGVIRTSLVDALNRDGPTANNRFLPLLDVLVARYRQEYPDKTHWDADVLTQHVDTLMTMFLAADVSSMYVYGHIAQSPAVAAELRKEHNAVFPHDVTATLEELCTNPGKIRQLPYTTAVIKESMRLRPPGVSATIAPKGHTVQHKGVEHQLEGRLLYANISRLQSNENYAPDPFAFDPNRWLPSPGADLANSWRPFQRGQHSCMGENMMMPGLAIALVLTVRDMDFSLAYDASDVALSPEFGGLAYMDGQFAAKPAKGLPVTVKVLSS